MRHIVNIDNVLRDQLSLIETQKMRARIDIKVNVTVRLLSLQIKFRVL